MARPSKYSQEIADAICAAVARGVPMIHAAGAAGIGITTVKAWRDRKRPFQAALKKARASAIQARVERIQQVATGGIEVERRTITKSDGTVEEIVKRTPPQWQADAWWLERQVCDQFGLNRLELREIQKRVKELVEEFQNIFRRNGAKPIVFDMDARRARDQERARRSAGG